MKTIKHTSASRRSILAGDILRKGGAHGPSRKAQRAADKRGLSRDLRQGVLANVTRGT